MMSRVAAAYIAWDDSGVAVCSLSISYGNWREYYFIKIFCNMALVRAVFDVRFFCYSVAETPHRWDLQQDRGVMSCAFPDAQEFPR